MKKNTESMTAEKTGHKKSSAGKAKIFAFEILRIAAALYVAVKGFTLLLHPYDAFRQMKMLSIIPQDFLAASGIAFSGTLAVSSLVIAYGKKRGGAEITAAFLLLAFSAGKIFSSVNGIYNSCQCAAEKIRAESLIAGISADIFAAAVLLIIAAVKIRGSLKIN